MHEIDQLLMSVYIEFITVKLIFNQKSRKINCPICLQNFGLFTYFISFVKWIFFFVTKLLNFLLWMSLKLWINHTQIYYTIIFNEITFSLLYNKAFYINFEQHREHGQNIVNKTFFQVSRQWSTSLYFYLLIGH